LIFCFIGHRQNRNLRHRIYGRFPREGLRYGSLHATAASELSVGAGCTFPVNWSNMSRFPTIRANCQIEPIRIRNLAVI
jgi:hypothetical protein